MIDKLRYWLIRKLSCGDMILMNFERQSDGMLAQRNLGPVYIENVDITFVESSVSVGIWIGDQPVDAALSLRNPARHCGGIYFRNVFIRMGWNR